MEKLKNLLDELVNKLFSSTYQLQRIVILVGVVLVLAVASFGGYYYYDRYYRPQPTKDNLTIADAEQAVRKSPQDPKAHLALAETYMLNYRFADAIAQAEQVKPLDPKNVSIDYIIGISLANSSKCQDALEPLNAYIEKLKDEDMPGLDRRLQAAAYYLGDCYLQLGKAQEAIKVLELDVNWSKTDADAMYKLGMAYAADNQHDKAVNMFQGAVAYVPNYSEAYVAMAASYEKLGKPARASYARGMLAYAQKDYSAAQKILLEAAQADPGFPPTFTGLGMTYEALKDLPNAKASYEAAYKLDPNNFTASTGIQRVQTLINK